MADTISTEESDYFLDAFNEFPFYDCPDSPLPSQSTPSLSSNVSLPPSHAPSSTVLLHSPPFRDWSRILDLTSTSVMEKENQHSKGVTDNGQFNFVYFLAELLVKGIGFQFNMLISFVTFPIWVFYYSCLLALNPFHVLKLFRGFLMRKLMRVWDGVWNEWFKEHKAVVNLALRCGWGLFWSVYVCTVLMTLLISSFVISGLIMRYCLVEEPFRLEQSLNFDYTQSKPVALLPITYCHTEGEKNDSNGKGVRPIPLNQKLQTTVSLVLPESHYNRNLGIFQIRVELLSENGKSLASLSHPGMLEFKSKPIRLLSTLFKIIPLVTGYVSEAQTVILKFRGYREGYIPTACLKVTIEQRAEYREGAGIPEVYDAFLYLESELPFLKRILWFWRRTLFVWLAMVVFGVELMFAFVCCRPVVIPRSRKRSDVDAS